jgi:GTPase SAR1 family protein
MSLLFYGGLWIIIRNETAKKGSTTLLNYANLNDVEFEYLCQDIMSKKLQVNLRRFATGRDGGIDLTDDPSNHNIIVQVKHYIKTNVNGLIAALRDEVSKVKKLHPNQYYVCCSQKLSPAKTNEIYTLFSDYMGSAFNVVTLIEIEDFLVAPENIDILRKHYKLWISSTTLLDDIQNNDIFIDCEALLSSIHEDEKYFVQTLAYDHALECLENNQTLCLIGDPGVGKTTTSKMLLLHFTANGYRARYTTDGANLSSLKNSLSQNPDIKEIVLLDDCFGQAYFNMKETQGNELLSLVRYVKQSSNKLLILNSRVTIFREAQERTPELIKSKYNKEYKLQVLDMSAMSDIEKAIILYNHLYFNGVDAERFAAIKQKKNYQKIVLHANYNPRIIEFVSNPRIYADIPPEHYFSFIVKNLNNPNEVWDDEYERKLSIVDRVLLTTLYSLTNSTCLIDFVEKCFNERIKKLDSVDKTVNQFKSSLSRLQNSFVKIVDKEDRKMLTMSNPSVNDYLGTRLSKNSLERDDLVGGAASVRQLKRLFNEDDFERELERILRNGTIPTYIFEDEGEKRAFIAYCVADKKILDSRYKEFVFAYLKNMKDVNIYEKEVVLSATVFQNLLDEDVCKFYGVDTLLENFVLLKKILSNFGLEDLITAVTKCYNLYGDHDEYLILCKELIKEEIVAYCDVDVIDFDISVYKHISAVCQATQLDAEPDFDEAAESIVQETVSIVLDEITGYLDTLPEALSMPDTFIDELHISVSGAENLVESYVQADYDADDDKRYYPAHSDLSEVDYIFDR